MIYLFFFSLFFMHVILLFRDVIQTNIDNKKEGEEEEENASTDACFLSNNSDISSIVICSL